MQLRILGGLAAVCMLFGGGVVQAELPKPDIKTMVDAAVLRDIHAWADVEIVRLSVSARNRQWSDIDQTKIDALDKAWRTEREADDKPLISATLSNPLSIYLSRIQGRSLGLYAEIFVMDEHGLNVGQSSITSDFWQGDEDKFQKTFDIGNDAVFIDEPEWDDEAKIWRGQVSFTLAGQASAAKIGAVTVELNLTELARRQGFRS